MRHRKKYRTLGIDSERRKHLLRNLAISLIEHERIVTTDAKAKEIVKYVSKLVTMAKVDDLSSRRRALSIVPNKIAIRKLYSDIAPKFSERNGGYLRIMKKGFRKGDAAPVSVVEFVD